MNTLFDTPASPTCRTCGTPVLRVRDDETGVSVDLEPQPVPVTRPLTPADLTYENHPRVGWHCQPVPDRRGYPIHLMHTQAICQSKSQAKARTSP